MTGRWRWTPIRTRLTVSRKGELDLHRLSVKRVGEQKLPLAKAKQMPSHVVREAAQRRLGQLGRCRTTEDACGAVTHDPRVHRARELLRREQNHTKGPAALGNLGLPGSAGRGAGS